MDEHADLVERPRFASKKYWKDIAGGLKDIYEAKTVAEATACQLHKVPDRPVEHRFRSRFSMAGRHRKAGGDK